MDKYEYKLKTEQMLELMEEGAYRKAAELADEIDWRKVRNVTMLMNVSDIYENHKEYQKSYDVLNIAYRRAEGSRKVIYRLCTLALKTGNVDEAIDFYDDFMQIAPKDPNQFILRYQILRAQKAPVEQQIEALEEFKKSEYIEEWAYELAKLYQEAGMTAECLEECDDLILWFSEGKYVYKAMELKMQYKPLTPSQQEKYDHRFEKISAETEEMPSLESLAQDEESDAAAEKPVEDTDAAEPKAAVEVIPQTARAEDVSDGEDDPGEDRKKKIGDTMRLDEALHKLLHREPQKKTVKTDTVAEEPEPVEEEVIEENLAELEEIDFPEDAEETENELDDTVSGSLWDEPKQEELEEDISDLEDAIGEIESVVDLDMIDRIAEEKAAKAAQAAETKEADKAAAISGAMKEIIPEEPEEEDLLENVELDLAEAEEFIDEVSTGESKEEKEEDEPAVEDPEVEAHSASWDDGQIAGQMSLEDILAGWDSPEEPEETAEEPVVEETSAAEESEVISEATVEEPSAAEESEEVLEETTVEETASEESEEVPEETTVEETASEESEEVPEEAAVEETEEVSEETAEAPAVEEPSEAEETEEIPEVTPEEPAAEEIEEILETEESEEIPEEEILDIEESEEVLEEDVSEPEDILDEELEEEETEEILEEEEPEEISEDEESEEIPEDEEPEEEEILEAEDSEDAGDDMEEELEDIPATEKKKTEPILPPDIQRLIDEIEGVIPPEEPKPKKPEKKVDDEPRENKGKLADELRIDDDLDLDDEEFLIDEDAFSDDGEELYAEEAEDEEEEFFDGEEGFDEGEVVSEGEEFLDEEEQVPEEEEFFDEEEEFLDEGEELSEDEEEILDDIDSIFDDNGAPDLEEEFRVNPEHSSEPDDREIPDDDDDDMDILSATTPLSRKETAKLIATGKTAPLPLNEISDALSMSDTGFIVHGRYDLEMQSGIGTRAGLTEEQKKLFSYFVPVRGMSEQLVDVLEQDKNCTNREGTSRTGNLLIIGNKGNGKTVLAVDVVKAIQKQREIRQGKVAIVTGESLNKKKISDIFEKLYGGALIIEKAGKMSEKTVARLNRAMEKDTGELLIVLEEQRKPLDRLLSSNREFRRKFTSRLEVPIFINDELVTFGQTYAQENGYRIDEMGILALYSRIDSMQREDHAVTVAEVKEIMDEAIRHSQKASAKKLVRRVFGRNTDEADRILLSEKDFNV